jgi:ABC-type Fe3+/spermidine/putrescine transport system ATPase subunit
MSATLVCRSVSIDYGPIRAVRGLDLTVEAGETVALLGPSGSGKSTLMYAIAGFVEVAEGDIDLCGVVVSTPTRLTPPERRPVGLVFQSYALWPHLTAEETVAYPLRRAGMGKREALESARALLETLGVGELAGRLPAALSGGQQQRVGLARALARAARLYLFDEPTAHLDSSVRLAVQEEIGRRRRATGAAAVYATHDAAEALAIADRVAILREGATVQIGAPWEIYDRPVDVWAARLTGPASLLRVQVVGGTPRGLEVALDGVPMSAEAAGDPHAGTADMLIRPDWVTPGGPLRGVVEEVWFRGTHTDYRVETPAGLLEARVPGRPRVRVGETAGWTVTRGWIPAT